jgi:hypothetical protein
MTPEGPTPPATRGVHPGWILFFGILEIVIALLCALMVAGMMALALFGGGALKAAGAAGGALAMVFPTLFYGAIALLLLLGGAGTLARRRWARILMIVVASFWLIFGLLGGATIVAMIPMILSETAKGGRTLAPGISAAVWLLVGGGTLFFGVVLPGSLLLFYTRRSVKAAFEARDPEESTAGKLPLPVTILAVWIGIGAVASVFSAPYRIVVLFGFVFSGPAAVTLVLAGAAIQGFFVWRIGRREAPIWWAILLYYSLMGISATVSVMGGSMDEVFRRIGAMTVMDPSQRPFFEWMQSWTPWMILVSQILFLAFVVFTRRYFGPDEAARRLPAAG